MEFDWVIFSITSFVLVFLWFCYKFQINIFKALFEVLTCPIRLLFCLLSD